MITTIAFDADDTLWQNETLFREAQAKLAQILAEWETPEGIMQAIMKTERQNMPIYGYGVKAFTLSMFETALAVSHREISSETIQEILALGRSMLQAEAALLPHVTETLQSLQRNYHLMVITQGDLLEQTSKLTRSGLGGYFSLVEVLHQKTPDTYKAILKKYNLDRKTFLMVGNSLRSDIAPVLALGAKAVHIPNQPIWELELLDDFDPLQEGFYKIDTICQLPSLLDKLNAEEK
jgi:putative hydrolase of the HAD superfamily